MYFSSSWNDNDMLDGTSNLGKLIKNNLGNGELLQAT